jgi:hypothetical protein
MGANHLRGIIAVAAFMAATGCMRRGRVAEPARATSTAVTTARIKNNNWLDIKVYAVRGGSRERIGIVRAFDTQVFELPRHLLDTRGLRLFVDLIGSQQWYQTDLIPVWPGQLIDLVVQDRLVQSHYSVFDP